MRMKKLLMFLVLLTVSVGTWAYSGEWTNGSYRLTLSVDQSVPSANVQRAGEQIIHSDAAGLFTAWKSAQLDEFGYLENGTHPNLKLTGTWSYADLQLITGSPKMMSNYAYIDMSEVTITDIPEGKYLVDLGFPTSTALVIPKTNDIKSQISKFQNTQDASNNYYKCVSYFEDENNLYVYSLSDDVKNLKAAVTTETSILALPYYTNDGGYDYNHNGGLYPKVDATFLSGLAELPAIELDLTWVNVSELRSKVENGGDGKFHFESLNTNTHYLVIPQNSHAYVVGDDFTNETDGDYVYSDNISDNIWVVSTYKGTESPYATGTTFGGQFLKTDNIGINETTNITYIRKNGALAGATPYLTDYAKSAKRMVVVSKEGAGSLTAEQGYVSDLVSMKNVHSQSIDLTQYIVPSGESIGIFENQFVKSLALPDNTDPAIFPTILGNCSKEATSANTCIGTFNTSEQHLYTYSEAPNGVTKILQMMESTSSETNFSGHNHAENVEHVTMGGLLCAADIACNKNGFDANGQFTSPPTTTVTETENTDGDITGIAVSVVNPSGNVSGALDFATLSTADFSGACFVPQSDMVFGALGYGTVTHIDFPSKEVVVDGTTYQQTQMPASCCNNLQNLTGELVIPDNYTSIGAAAFAGTKYTSATFGSGVRTIGEALFSNCTELAEVSFNIGLTGISDYCLAGNSKLTNVDIPEGVTEIGAMAFWKNDAMKTLRLPQTLELIDNNAFQQCSVLETLTIPENVESIGHNAFNLCYGLTDIYFLATDPEKIPVVPSDAFDESAYANNNACGATTETGNNRTLTDYKPISLTDAPTYQIPIRKVNYEDWATFQNGVKKSGAVVMHYPLVNTEEGYVEDDNYASKRAAYEEANAEYLAAVENVNPEVRAAYEEALANYNEVKDIVLYSDQNGTTVYTGDVDPNETYYVETEEPNYIQVDASSIYNEPYVNNSEYKAYTLSSDGTYQYLGTTMVDDMNNNWGPWNYGTNIYVYKEGDTRTVYTPLDAETQEILAAGKPTLPGVPDMPIAPTTLVLNNGSYEDYAGPVVEGTTYYNYVAAGSDILAEYYTVPQRNAQYKGVYDGDADDGNTHGITVWPDQNDAYLFKGDRTKYPTSAESNLKSPDDKDRSGLKNFMLVAGIEATSPDITVFEHIKTGVWYTICLPFDLTDTQLKGCFGGGYELAEFSGVVEKEDKTGIILEFTTGVTEVNGVKARKHHPYMIHPSVFKVDDQGNPTTTVYTVTGVNRTETDLTYTPVQVLASKVTQTFNGTTFTFTGLGHNYENGEEFTLLPKYCYFLGTAQGETYPRYWREGADTKVNGELRTSGYWTKNTAVVLPSYEYDPDTQIYTCTEYIYTPTGGTSNGVKSMDIVFTDKEFDPDAANAIDIIEKEENEVEKTVSAQYLNKVFNLNGQMVGNSAEGLPKGMYIMNGKKFIVK